MKYLNNILLCLSLMALFAACSNDDTEPEVDVTDANALTESVDFNVDNATQVDGAPPAPTANAPQITNTSASDITVNPGGEVYLGLEFSQAQSDIEGFYLQVDGADSYFDIPLVDDTEKSGLRSSGKRIFFANTAKNGVDSGAVSLPFKLPENVKVGRFCVSYCVYDSTGNVSNVVSRCIEITKDDIGIDRTGLLADNRPWKLVESVFVEGDYIDTTRIGVVERDTVFREDSCLVIEEYIQNFWHVKFRKSGRFVLVDNYSDELISSPENCYMPDSIEASYYGDFEDVEFGYWTFDSEKDILTIFVKDEDDSDDGTDDDDDDGDIARLKVLELTENRLVVVNLDATDDYIERYTFERD